MRKSFPNLSPKFRFTNNKNKPHINYENMKAEFNRKNNVFNAVPKGCINVRRVVPKKDIVVLEEAKELINNIRPMSPRTFTLPRIPSPPDLSCLLPPIHQVQEREVATPTPGMKRAKMIVLIRIRPENDNEKGPFDQSVVCRISNTGLRFDTKTNSRQTKSLNFKGKRLKDVHFYFDRLYGPEHKNSDIFDTSMNNIISRVMNGFNCTVMSYGAADSGKNHTIFGTQNDPGISLLMADELYHHAEEIDNDVETQLFVSFIEVYNEGIIDLLNPHATVQLRDDGHEGFSIPGLSTRRPKNITEFISFYQYGRRARRCHVAHRNELGSRTHTILQITIFTCKRNPSVNGKYKTLSGKLTFVTFSGSDKMNCSAVHELRFVENRNIYKSIISVATCLNALAERKSHIPYRSCTVTRILRETFTANCFTVLIGNVSPSSVAYEETLQVLMLCDRIKNIKVTCKRNISYRVYGPSQPKNKEQRKIVADKSKDSEKRNKRIAKDIEKIRRRQEKEKQRKDAILTFDCDPKFQHEIRDLMISPPYNEKKPAPWTKILSRLKDKKFKCQIEELKMAKDIEEKLAKIDISLENKEADKEEDMSKAKGDCSNINKDENNEKNSQVVTLPIEKLVELRTAEALLPSVERMINIQQTMQAMSDELKRNEEKLSQSVQFSHSLYQKLSSIGLTEPQIDQEYKKMISALGVSEETSGQKPDVDNDDISVCIKLPPPPDEFRLRKDKIEIETKEPEEEQLVVQELEDVPSVTENLDVQQLAENLEDISSSESESELLLRAPTAFDDRRGNTRQMEITQNNELDEMDEIDSLIEKHYRLTNELVTNTTQSNSSLHYEKSECKLSSNGNVTQEEEEVYCPPPTAFNIIDCYAEPEFVIPSFSIEPTNFDRAQTHVISRITDVKRVRRFRRKPKRIARTVSSTTTIKDSDYTVSQHRLRQIRSRYKMRDSPDTNPNSFYFF